MPLKDYINTVIYCVKHEEDYYNENCYVGSTTNYVKRKAQHKSDCNNTNSVRYNTKIYNYIRNNGGWEKWVMYELEKYPCNDKRECETRERYWYDKMKCTLNCNRPQLNDDDIEQIRQKYQLNEVYREELKEKRRQAYKNDSQYRSYKINKVLERYYKNRDEIKEKCLARYYKKKNDINESPLT